jgi:5'-3' exonuclease
MVNGKLSKYNYKINKKSYDNIYIDLNPILHISINKAKSEKDLLKKIIWYTDEILKHLIPRKRIIFSTDGIPAFAKMILQRERRINMVKHIEIKNQNNFINPIILTPGTDFMNNLSKYLKDYFETLQKKYANIEITHLINIEHGESEFKLFNKMNENIQKDKNNENHILVSNDADVVIMALSIVKDKNIMICNSGKEYREINLNKFFFY